MDIGNMVGYVCDVITIISFLLTIFITFRTNSIKKELSKYCQYKLIKASKETILTTLQSLIDGLDKEDFSIDNKFIYDLQLVIEDLRKYPKILGIKGQINLIHLSHLINQSGKIKKKSKIAKVSARLVSIIECSIKMKEQENEING